MVAAYIITRMVIVITDKEKTGIVSTILAGITIMVSLYCIYVIISSGVKLLIYYATEDLIIKKKYIAPVKSSVSEAIKEIV